jgi:putative tricarboxylic transport membrane protein
MARIKAFVATAGRICLGAGALLAHAGAPAQPAWRPDRPVEIVVTCQPGNAITALLGGHVQAVPASVGLWVNPLKAGQVRLIAVSAPRRLGGEIAQVPTRREQGIDAVVSVWCMITAPPALWEDALRKTVDTAEWKRDLERNYQSDDFLVGRELGRPSINSTSSSRAC